MVHGDARGPPGFDDPDGLRKKLNARPTADQQKNLLERLDGGLFDLILKAFLQAGWPRELIDRPNGNTAKSAFGPASIWPGVTSCRR